MQQPWAQRESVADFGVDGWVNTAFLYGLGVGVVGVGCVGALILLGFSTYPRRKLVAFLIVLMGMVVQVVAMRSLAQWGSWKSAQGFQWFVYPRYTIPAFMVLIALALIVKPISRPLLNRLQAGVISLGLVFTSVVSLLAVMARYMHGQDHSWVQFDPNQGWWWSWGPDPIVIIAAATLASIVFFPAMLSFGVLHPDQPRGGKAARRKSLTVLA
jgi:hypothetical protein